ncbi:mitochondrial import inner membrane translocase subunit Tim54 [Tirmania nivea]|nr:mitochondrial import inner membrane translocase subunit Tim54 [Tirmania nivea]
MATLPPSGEAPPAAAPTPPPSLPPKVNPALQYLGLGKFCAKLPSRNWLIFLGVVSTWTGLIVYDRREKKRVQTHWCSRVSHLAELPMSTKTLPRKITIYLAAPPGDGISAAKDYFREYVKPVLIAAAVDYEVVEGRRGGEIRNAVGEKVRRWRRTKGESGRPAPGEEEEEVGAGESGMTPKKLREMYGITREVPEDDGGVMVVGRHTWKEFIRGTHEGWLGPPDSQVQPPLPPPPTEEGKAAKAALRAPIPPSTVKPEEYHEKPLPPTFPYERDSLPIVSPVAVVPFPHLLGFLNTPIRIYRYLTQRRLADRVGRETAALCVGFSHPFHAFIPTPLAEDGQAIIVPYAIRSVDGKANGGDGRHGGDIDVDCYSEEELDWDKKYRVAPSDDELVPPTKTVMKEGPNGEKIEEQVEDLSEQQRYQLNVKRDAKEWAGSIFVDGRIVGRMKRYDQAVVTPEAEFQIQ